MRGRSSLGNSSRSQFSRNSINSGKLARFSSSASRALGGSNEGPSPSHLDGSQGLKLQDLRKSLSAGPSESLRGVSISRRNSLLIGTSLAGLALSDLPLAGRKALAADLASSGAETELVSKSLGLEDRVAEFKLKNGLRFVVLERHKAPVVSCYTFADVGAFEEEDGKTGVAHLLEHLAFKGTDSFGTKDFARERPILAALDETFYALRDARRAGRTEEVAKLQLQLTKLQEEAEEWVQPNAFGNALEREGAVGLNAQTSQDETIYYCSLPRNKLELWFALEAERFINPVFRQLYKEKEVVLNERRLRIDLPPLGKYQETFALLGMKNNYRRPVIGFENDINDLGRLDVNRFFREHYGPDKLVITVVGDITVDQVQRLAEKYFEGWTMDPASSPLLPPPPSSAYVNENPLPENLLKATRESNLLRWESPAGPLFMDGYYRPPGTAENALAIDFICDILGGGRTARLYQNLVLPGKALNATVLPSYPGEKRANMVLTYGTPGPGADTSPEKLAQLFRRECEEVAASGARTGELLRVKKSAKESLLEGLLSNSSLASFLAEYTTRTGSWRNILRDLDKIQELGNKEVQAAAGELFRAENRFSGVVAKPSGLAGILRFD